MLVDSKRCTEHMVVFAGVHPGAQSTTCAAAAALGAQMHTVPQFGLLLSCSVCLGDWARIAVTAGLTVVGRVGWG